MRLGRAAALAAAMIAWTGAARAAELELEVRGCPDGDVVRAAARVELAGPEPGTSRIAVVCLEADRVLVVAFPRGGGRPTAREVTIDDVASSSRSRAVAIVVAELVRQASTPEAPGASPAPPVPVHAPLAAPGAPSAASPWVMPTSSPAPTVVLVGATAPDAHAPAGWTVGGALHLRGFSAAGTIAVGPAVELDAPLGDSALRVRGAAHLGLSAAQRPVGEATITTWTGSASVLARVDAGGLTLDAGPRVELGVATAAGTPAPDLSIERTTTTAPLFLAGGQVVLGARMASVLVPHVAVDAGGVLAGIAADVDAERALTIAGLFVGVRAGLSIGPAPAGR